mmetsp:Transcript_170/g.353  ORF Transcript_170/g.353 Transcript_170/m.353 type:complete len:217 (-) Transcript_170:299-949(-)
MIRQSPTTLCQWAQLVSTLKVWPDMILCKRVLMLWLACGEYSWHSSWLVDRPMWRLELAHCQSLQSPGGSFGTPRASLQQRLAMCHDLRTHRLRRSKRSAAPFLPSDDAGRFPPHSGSGLTPKRQPQWTAISTRKLPQSSTPPLVNVRSNAQDCCLFKLITCTTRRFDTCLIRANSGGCLCARSSTEYWALRAVHQGAATGPVFLVADTQLRKSVM